MGGVAVAPDGSLYISETDIGRIWRIIYTGETANTGTPAARMGTTSNSGALPASATVLTSPGRTVYEQYCAPCHMIDGSGAGQLQPALMGSAVVRGDPAQLVAVILRGPAAVLPPDRAKFSNIMPAFNLLTDRQIADLTTYLRQQFGGGSSAVADTQVSAVRGQ